VSVKAMDHKGKGSTVGELFDWLVVGWWSVRKKRETTYVMEPTGLRALRRIE
jgi:hypothetical protein